MRVDLGTVHSPAETKYRSSPRRTIPSGSKLSPSNLIFSTRLHSVDRSRSTNWRMISSLWEEAPGGGRGNGAIGAPGRYVVMFTAGNTGAIEERRASNAEAFAILLEVPSTHCSDAAGSVANASRIRWPKEASVSIALLCAR